MLFKNKEEIIQNGQTPKLKQIRNDILDVLECATEAVDPYNCVKSRFNKNIITLDEKTIDISDFENVYLVGFGKASIGMAKAVCDSIKIKEGIIVTNDLNTDFECKNIYLFVGGHPIPNQNRIIGAEKILETVEKCTKNDLLIVLISGGGSALFSKPRISLEDLQKTTDLLLKCGANINEINTIRKHLSYVKGGQLAKCAKCTVVSLIISDIIGDPLEFIASGPTYPDSTTFSDAEKILQKYNLWQDLPDSIKNTIEDGLKGKISETPKKNDPVFENVFNFIIANNKIACKAAEDKAEELGYKTMLLTTRLDGEAKSVGKYLSDKAISYLADVQKIMFISGGETIVNIIGEGKGGRNQELVLSCVKNIYKKNIAFSSFATDGIDGNSDAAGAIADGFTFEKAQYKNMNPDAFLKENNSNKFFKNLSDLFTTGPTGTNVMDIQIIVKYA